MLRLEVRPKQPVLGIIFGVAFAASNASHTTSSEGLKCFVHFILREFKHPDLEALWQLDQKCFPPGISYSREELKTYVSAQNVFTLVAEALSNDVPDAKPSEILGFIVAQANRKRVGHIITIDVADEGRRKGIGSSLLAAAETRLREIRCDRIRLETAVDNGAALAFYKIHGYQVEKKVLNYYSSGSDAFVLVKPLSML